MPNKSLNYEQRSRILHLCFQIWNVDAESDWAELHAAMNAVLTVNGVEPNLVFGEIFDADKVIGLEEWEREYEMSMNVVATCKSFTKFCAVLTKYYSL